MPTLSDAPISVVLCTNQYGLLGAASTCASLIANAGVDRRIHIFLVHSDISSNNLALFISSFETFHDRVDVTLTKFDPTMVSGLLRSKRIPPTAYARLFVGTLLPNDVHRCVYLDIDLLFNRDVVELFDLSLQGHIVGAVVDAPDGSDGEEHFRRLGLGGGRYFNSGLMLIDLVQWREKGVEERALAFARQAGDRLIQHDQDALNATLDGQWFELDREWNWWMAAMPPQPASTVIHMALSPKPWHADYKGLHAGEFFRYLDMTAFRGWRPRYLWGLGSLVSSAVRKVPYYANRDAATEGRRAFTCARL